MGDSNRYYVAECDGNTLEVEIRPTSVFGLTRVASLIINNRRAEELNYGPGRFTLRGCLGDGERAGCPVIVRIRDGLFLPQKVSVEINGKEVPVTRVY